jgi:N-acetylglucosamine kinase-like BadF-type ATPase
MIKLVVDSGSTKADWILIKNDGERVLTHTMGFNPYFHSAEKMFEELSKPDFSNLVPRELVDEVYFYGAGCSDDAFCSVMMKGLILCFPNAQIRQVHHDLLGAARATCGHKAGIAGILGTGSNSCLYDGKIVVDNITALAHVLADDGAGVDLGRLLLRAYYYRELPKELEDAFNSTYPEGKRAIIHRIYGENQNVQIANFAQFVMEHKEHAFFKALIHDSFTGFVVRHLKKYEGHKTLPINFVGSVAHVLKDELALVLTEQGMSLGSIIRRPIEKLADFHQS